VTGGHNTRVSLAALIATRPGHPVRLIYRTRTGHGKDQRKGFTENIHVSRAMRELVAARSWLRVYRLPPYASELNPVEPVWSNLKRSLANLTKQDIGQLTALARTRLRRMQYRPGLLDGFLAKTGLDLGNFHN
jgi:DDE superfamily endonuclease